jgi:hypothetical protein
MIDPALREEVNKRLTLNWLIQGASQHAGITLHHLVRDELDAIDARLLHMYDQFALVNVLQYWHVDAMLLLGRPGRFWRCAATKPRHPFFAHPLLSQYGGELADASRQRALDRSKGKGLTTLPVVFSFQATYLLGRLRAIESRRRHELIHLAKEAASRVWGIPTDRFDADLVPNVPQTNAFDALPTAESLRGHVLTAAIVGYGGIARRNDSLTVVARATNWQLLAKELVKGTAELICLHGLNELADDAYAGVVRGADKLEYEPWMLQSGGELWRRLLMLIPPDGMPVAEVLMHLSRLPAASLESLVRAVIEQSDDARRRLARLG